VTRRNFSMSTIKARLEYCGWQCEGKLPDGSRCPTIVSKGRFRCDHVLPDWLGGDNSFENSQILCLACDGVKTPKDQSNIAKVKRQECADYRMKVRKGRPLPCGRRSPFKKKINGTVVLRARGR
jgi:HNH endonuclease